MPFLISTWLAKELHLHLLEFTSSKCEVARGYFITERFPLLRDSEWDTYSAAVDHVVEIDKHCLRGLRAKVDDVVIAFNWPDMRPKHEVEVARRAEDAIAIGAIVSVQQVGTIPTMALIAFRQRVGKAVDVTTRHPYVWVHQDRCVNANDVLAVSNHRFPPLILDVALQFNADRTVVVKASDSAVYLAALEDESPPFAKAHYGIQTDVIEVAFQCGG